MLTEIGASEAEERVYRYLTTLASATAKEVATACGLGADSVRATLARLERRSLVTRTADRPIRYVAAPPSIVEHMLADRQQALQHARTEVADVAAEYHRHVRADGASEAIEVVTDPTALNTRARHLQLSARKELCGLVKPPFVAFDMEEASREVVLDKPTVRYRMVYDAAMLTPEVVAALREAHADQEDLRVHPNVPVKLIVADRSAAILKLGPGNDTTAAGLVAHASGLLDALEALFEYVWSAATPLHLDVDGERMPDSPLTADQQHLLSLLLAGRTDQAIGTQLGISRRTVHRRLQSLMDLAGVRTRTELILFATRHGWI